MSATDINDNKNKNKKTSKEATFTSLRQFSYSKLFKKYSSGDFSFEKIEIDNLIYNETCRVVARFKDFLIYDDNTEFLRRFYPWKDIEQRLNKILKFYDKYSKIFPNYLVLKENKYLYRNIRKKQKMIDAINEIKREERENKNKLQNMGNKKKSSANKELFTKKVKDEIKNFQKQISFKKYNNSFDTDKNDEDNTLLINQNSISISLLNWKQYEKNSNSNSNFDEKINRSNNWGPNIDSFMTIQTNGTLSDMVNVLNDNKLYVKDIQNIFSDKNKFQIHKKQINNNNNKDNKKMKNSGKNNTNDKKIKTNSKTTINNKKNINDKNYTYKYAKTSNNATNSSSILSKRAKNRQTSSSACKNQKKIKENENIKEKKSNVYQYKSPKIGNFKIKKNFCKTNTNINKVKASLNKNKKKNNINTEDNLLLKQNENISKKYIKCKHISQDFDSNTISKVTNNILKNNTNINTSDNNNIKSINFYTDNNPNLITGNTILNTKNNNLEKKVHVNVRDIIKNNKEKEKDIILNTAEKIKNDSKAKLVLKMTRMRTNNYMTSSSLKINNENSINKKRNFSLVNKEKTGNKIENKKLLTKQQKSKTKGIFIKIKTLDKKRNLKEVKEKTKEKNNEKPKVENKILLENKNNEKNNTIIIEANKDDNNLNLSEKKQQVDIITTSEKNDDNENKAKNKTIEQKDEIKSEPNEAIYIYDINKNKNMSEREMSSNLSDSNTIKILNQKTFTPHKFQPKFQNNHLFNTLNRSTKFASNGFKRKFKTFLVKKKKRRKIKTDQNHNSQKNLLSINILNRIKEAKKNRTKNNFYKTGLIQNSSEINTNTINLTKSTQFKNNTINLTKTPLKKTSKLNFFKKNNTSQKFNIYKSTNKKEDSTKNYMSSFTIKVNKNIFNKDKNKNLKKTLSKNTNNVVRKINNNIKKECKK